MCCANYAGHIEVLPVSSHSEPDLKNDDGAVGAGISLPPGGLGSGGPWVTHLEANWCHPPPLRRGPPGEETLHAIHTMHDTCNTYNTCHTYNTYATYNIHHISYITFT